MWSWLQQLFRTESTITGKDITHTASQRFDRVVEITGPAMGWESAAPRRAPRQRCLARIRAER